MWGRGTRQWKVATCGLTEKKSVGDNVYVSQVGAMGAASVNKTFELVAELCVQYSGFK